MKVSEERLKEIFGASGLEPCDFEPVFYSLRVGEIVSMAKELLALRKIAPCQHQWNALKLVECGGRYQYCTLCGAKKVAE